MQRTLSWVGVDEPRRVDNASVTVAGSTLAAHGTQHAPDWSLAWWLECDDSWVTRRMRVHVLGAGLARTLDLHHDGAGGWVAVACCDDGTDVAATRPGIEDESTLATALDCDLAFSPLTNVMPIRRLGLVEGHGPEHVLTMAWIDVPTLQVIPSIQRYIAAAPGMVIYESERRDFRAELTVDDDGLVIDYPQLARRIWAS